jgi:hypothetical protein
LNTGLPDVVTGNSNRSVQWDPEVLAKAREEFGEDVAVEMEKEGSGFLTDWLDRYYPDMPDLWDGVALSKFSWPDGMTFKVYGSNVGPVQISDEAIEHLVKMSKLPAGHGQRPNQVVTHRVCEMVNNKSRLWCDANEKLEKMIVADKALVTTEFNKRLVTAIQLLSMRVIEDRALQDMMTRNKRDSLETEVTKASGDARSS